MFLQAAVQTAPLVVSDPAIRTFLEGLGDQAGAGIASVMIINALKRASFIPWISANTVKLNNLVSLCVAIIVGAGVEIHLTGSWSTGWQCNPCTTPDLHTMYTGVTRIFGQKMLQDVLYHHSKSPQPVTLEAAPPVNSQGKPIE